ncbi:hypothetical protein AAFC00_005202 [Neodothiora populina]|uniref:Capsule polysaccharide biosynthesis protein n=1 Tax=Neodothiora populina TaxID=2781224 RepID=A0ABR3PK44_9PEZI
MSAAQRLPVLVSTLGVGAALVALVAVPSARETASRYLGVSAPGGTWRLLAIGFALLNVKSLPFAWHYRVFRHILYQLYLAPKPMTAPQLFKPIITSSYNAITECDYNLHKSNSTYFADLDAARAALMGALLRKSLARLNKGDMTGLPEEAKTTKGKYIIALGGIACTFRKEIKPLEQFDIWTKVLTWDEKWIYVVSHVVKKNTKQPSTFFLQPWKKGSKKTQTADAGLKEEKDWTKSVFATSIAKYVCKKGRLTIPPEVFLTRGDLLPPKPSNVPTPAATAIDTPATTGQDTPANLSSPENLAADVMEKLGQTAGADKSDDAAVYDADGMTWEEVEKVRLRGLELAKNFDSLAKLHGEFGAEEEVLGKYSDFFW